MEKDAINVVVATATFNNNNFRNIRNRSITLREWNRVIFDYNRFQLLEPNSILMLPSNSTPASEFAFTNNELGKVSPRSLSFVSMTHDIDTLRFKNNNFKVICKCDSETWLAQIVGDPKSSGPLLDSSRCIVDNFLKNCFNLPEDNFSMRDYARTICSHGHERINCTRPSEKPSPKPSPPNIGPHVYPRNKGYFDVDMGDWDQLAREKMIIIVVCMSAVFAVIIVILASGVLYMRRRGVCPKLTTGVSTFTNSWFSPTSEMTAATSARSISRLSINEYAGLQSEPRIMDQTLTSDIIDDEPETLSNFYAENKATQTLPEELTEDYLKDLQDKLKDPEHYGHARDIIEHLYDLIKVEESCNNNNWEERRRSTVDPADDNAYDVIQPRVKSGTGKASVSIGTKAPSLEKLLPSTIARSRPQIVEYAQPRDQRVNVDQNHLYAELPWDETFPSTSRLSQPVSSSSHQPDLVTDHETKQNGGQVRPLNFFRSIGGGILGESSAHLYSELPERSNTAAKKMANRPLPTKPDQDSDCTVPLADL